MNQNVKSPLTYEEQIRRLKEFHKLSIDDKEKAVQILKKINYYRLSGYGIGLTMPNDKDKYRQGISLNHLYQLYRFDSELKNLLSLVIEQIEIQFRANISYHLAITYGALGYLESKNFADRTDSKGNSVFEKILEEFKSMVKRNKELPFVKHHINKYGGQFPIWVAVELFTFGNLTSLYSIMKDEDRQVIAKLYRTKDLYFNSWIRLLQEVRNLCAHYARLYNLILKTTPRLYKEYDFLTQDSKTKKTKIFQILIVLKKVLDEEQWNDFYSKFSLLLNRYSKYIKLSFMNFPNNWKEILEK